MQAQRSGPLHSRNARCTVASVQWPAPCRTAPRRAPDIPSSQDARRDLSVGQSRAPGSRENNMSKVALLTVHGMGETREDYHLSLLEALKTRLGSRFELVSVHRVYYQNLLQANEAAVWEACKDHVRYDGLRRFLLFGFADAAGLET